jgi:hypothetical protein
MFKSKKLKLWEIVLKVIHLFLVIAYYTMVIITYEQVKNRKLQSIILTILLLPHLILIILFLLNAKSRK